MDKMYYKTLIIMLLISSMGIINAQDLKVDKVSFEDFAKNVYVNDSLVKAAILLKSRKTYFVNKAIDKWEVVTEIHKRVRILKPNGLQYGIEKIKLSKDQENRETLDDIKATAYRNENGRLKRNKLKSLKISEKSLSETEYEIVIMPPNIEVGSIIDLQYKITSPFYKINDLIVQEEIPVKKYIADIRIPSFFEFQRILFGNPTLTTNEFEEFKDIKLLSSKKHFEDATGGGFKKVEKESILQVKVNVVQYEMADVPALIISDGQNHKQRSPYKIIYQLLSYNFPE